MVVYARSPHQPQQWQKKGAAYADTCQVDTGMTLHGVTIVADSKKQLLMRTSVNSVMVDRNYLATNFAGSLMQTLQGVPGVKAMSIGSGQSKPIIRGMGFNRMVVAENGIKHEGQQWGEDHGLEIDQFAIDRIEIIKGPAALTFGSDAIGGVVSLYSNYIPTRALSGSVSMMTRSNNESVGITGDMAGRHNRFYWRTRLTAIDYADYKVPTDTIAYYSYRIGLHNRRLRNTAGKELDGSLTLGYIDNRMHTDLQITNSFARGGFFANAHGLEVRNSKADYDQSRRDIGLPYHSVNHLKILSQTLWQPGTMTYEATLAYQRNVRKEFSEPISHGYMPKPENDLERKFNKNTYTALLKITTPPDKKHHFTAGLNAEYQHNRRQGWGFIIPDFQTLSLGAYVLDRYFVSQDLILNAGIRYDHAYTNISSYHDWYKTPVDNADSTYMERSADISRRFNSLTWSVGINYATGSWVLKANAGKSFRIPIPKELGADGVNYHIFRYEKGNPGLRPEESYQLDAGIARSNHTVALQLTPFINYFPNYIYMNPTPHFHEGLQLYNYNQSRVLRYGFEAEVNWKIVPALEATIEGEYLHAEQKSGLKKGYSLPFSPPWSARGELKYTFDGTHGSEGFVAVSMQIVGRQSDIVPPEEPTPGYHTLNMQAGKTWTLGHARLKLNLNAANLLNRKYYDHTGYYRLIYIPEPGRNLSLLATLSF